MIIHDVPQRSAAWCALRAGKLTGSSAAQVLKQRQRGTGELEGRAMLRRRLLCERITGLSLDGGPVTADMEHGRDTEARAIAAYEALTGQLVQSVGFCSHDTLAAGYSPDGIIGDFAGLLEVKCPKMTTHLEYLMGGVCPDEYRGQVLQGLWITGAPWCDVISFDDRFPEPLDVFIVRVERDEVLITSYEILARAFLADVDRDEAELRERIARATAAVA